MLLWEKSFFFFFFLGGGKQVCPHLRVFWKNDSPKFVKIRKAEKRATATGGGGGSKMDHYSRIRQNDSKPIFVLQLEILVFL